MRTLLALIAILTGVLMWVHPRYGRPEALGGSLLFCGGVLYFYGKLHLPMNHK